MEILDESPELFTGETSLYGNSYNPSSGMTAGSCNAVCKCKRITYPGASKKAFLSRVLRL